MTKPKPLGIAPFDPAEYLKDEESVAEFLNASMEMNDPTVLLNAVGTVARARSMTQLAEASGLGRESLYKALKPGSLPRYDTVMKVLGALGVEMVFRAPAKTAAKASKPGRKPVSRPMTTKLGATARAKSEETSAKPRVTRRSTP
ncbi:MAG: addiction module antidote protein [Pseudomonadota bacterium]